MVDLLHASLHEEFLEEASFLFDQRQRWLEDPQLSLPDVAQIEDRQEAHLDGLVLGGAAARDRCAAAIAEGDAGELHAALRVLCRIDDRAAVEPLQARLAAGAFFDEDDALAHRTAAGLALCFDVPTAWTGILAGWIARPELGSLVARAAGYRRLDLGDALLRHAIATSGSPDPWVIWALGELRHASARDIVRAVALQSLHPRIARVATLAALKLGERALIAELESGRGATPLDPIARALVDDSVAGIVRDVEAAPTPERVHALGLRGDRRALDLLAELIAEEAVVGSAAESLFMATAAPLFEPDDEPDLAELLPDPDDAIHPPKAEGPGAAARVRLSHDPDAWRSWIGEHVHLRVGERLRLGEVPSLRAAARAATTLAIPLSLREHLVDEMAIRYRHDPAFRPDMPARVQLEHLGGLLTPSAKARVPA